MLWIAGAFQNAMAAPNVTVPLGAESFDLRSNVEVLVDPEGRLTIEQIRKSGTFSRFEEPIVNLGITSDVCWIRAQILNTSDHDEWIAEIAYPPLDFIDFYYERPDGTVVRQRGGDRISFVNRFISFRNPNFRIELPAGEMTMVWVRVQTSSALQVPIEFFTKTRFSERIGSESFGFGVYYGLLLMVLAFNVVLALMTRDSIYIGYLGYLISYLVFQLSLNGVLFWFFLGEFPDVANGLLLVSFFLAVVGALTFTRLFLELSVTFSLADRVLKVSSYFCLLWVVLSLVVDYGVVIHVAAPVGVMFPILTLGAGVLVWRQGHHHARLFVVAWTFFLLGCIIFGLRSMGLLPANAFTLYAIQAGSTLEVVLLTLAIGERIARLRAERDIANDALSDSYELLDRETAIRDQLRTEVGLLRQEVAETSDKLLEADRLATLGTVMAGIAHDIANPSSMILTRSHHLKETSDETETLLKSLIGVPDSPDAIEVTDQFSEKFERLRCASDDIGMAAKRISSINSAVRNQARGSSWARDARLLKIVDECRVILGVKLMDITVQVHEEIPVELTCRRSQIGQVIMNLLNNAADAVHSASQSSNTPEISISLEYRDDDVVIQVEDSGEGIQEDDISKIFEIFYTTKSVGEGTGLGLAIVSRIVEEHAGYIEAGRSQVLGGAQITVVLPRQHEHQPQF